MADLIDQIINAPTQHRRTLLLLGDRARALATYDSEYAEALRAAVGTMADDVREWLRLGEATLFAFDGCAAVTIRRDPSDYLRLGDPEEVSAALGAFADWSESIGLPGAAWAAIWNSAGPTRH